jgi:L-aminopeptidase/D-esterase-like protein
MGGTLVQITLSTLIKRIHGKMGDVVFCMASNGETPIAKPFDMSKVKSSEAQKAHRQLFKLAVAYAKAAMAEPKVRAVYERMAAKKHKRPFAIAISDYFKGKDLLSKK